MSKKPMTKRQRQRLEAASCIDKEVRFKDKGGTGRTKMGTVLDEVYIIVSDYKHLIQQIKPETPYWDGSRLGYRTCYYTWDAERKNIKFGQYTQFLTQKEYTTLLSKARDKGWSIFKV